LSITFHNYMESWYILQTCKFNIVNDSCLINMLFTVKYVEMQNCLLGVVGITRRSFYV
jgi:hypothetical protein